MNAPVDFETMLATAMQAVPAVVHWGTEYRDDAVELTDAQIQAAFWRRGRGCYVPMTIEDAAAAMSITCEQARRVLARACGRGLLTASVIHDSAKVRVYEVRCKDGSRSGSGSHFNRASQAAGRRRRAEAERQAMMDRIRPLMEQGMGRNQIAEALGYHKNTIGQYLIAMRAEA